MSQPTALVVYPRERKRATTSVRKQLSKTGFVVESWPTDRVLVESGHNIDIVVYDPAIGAGTVLIEAKRYLHGELRRICERFHEKPVLLTTVNFDASLLKAALEVGATGVVPHHSLGLAARNLARVLLVGAGVSAGGSTVPARIDVVPEFHDPESGRLLPSRVAATYGISVATLASACGIQEDRLTKDADHVDIQPCLAELEFIWATLRRMLGSDELAGAWLRSRHRDLNGKAPLDVLTAGSVTQLADYLRSALAGEVA